MPGKPPTPIAVHKAKGTFRKSRHSGKASCPDIRISANLPDWFEKAVACAVEEARKRSETCPDPEWFAEILGDEWRRLSAIPHIVAGHSAAVQHTCILYLRMVLDAVGLRPMTSSERACLHSSYMQLGCTPASQAKVFAPAAEKAEDPWDKLG